MPKFPIPSVGDLRTRIAIQSATNTLDDAGGSSQAWNDILTTHAVFEAWKGTKQLQASQIQPGQWWDVVIRYPPTMQITKGMRVKDITTGDVYEIFLAADPDKTRRWLHLQVFDSNG